MVKISRLTIARSKKRHGSIVRKGIMSAEDKRLLLRLLAAVNAAEDRLSELQETPEDDELVLMLRAAILEAERSFPPTTYIGRELPTY